MLHLKSKGKNVLPIRRVKKAKRNLNSVVINEITYFQINLGFPILIPIKTKTRRISRERAKELFAKMRAAVKN